MWLRAPRFARVYARLSRLEDRGGLAARRRQLLAGLRGRVIEIGACNGLNFAHYPAGVTSVLAVEPEPHLRAIADRAADRAITRVTVVNGLAAALPAETSTFDAAVVSLVLCSVPDQQAALAEIERVLRPDGALCFLEHVLAPKPALRLVQRVVDATVGPRLFGGCRTSRDTLAPIDAAGFEVQPLDRFSFPDMWLSLPTSPHVLGVAARGRH